MGDGRLRRVKSRVFLLISFLCEKMGVGLLLIMDDVPNDVLLGIL